MPDPNPYCQAAHPDTVENSRGQQVPAAHCMRIGGHPGDHSAFIHRISTPEAWSA
jgi:hypothetical protein